MKSLILIVIIGAIGRWIYKSGKQVGSRKGYHAGRRHRHRHRR